MINGVSAAADSPALEVGELRKQPRVVQELHPIRHCQETMPGGTTTDKNGERR